jgi:hypothetical protein
MIVSRLAGLFSKSFFVAAPATMPEKSGYR